MCLTIVLQKSICFTNQNSVFYNVQFSFCFLNILGLWPGWAGLGEAPIWAGQASHRHQLANRSPPQEGKRNSKACARTNLPSSRSCSHAPLQKTRPTTNCYDFSRSMVSPKEAMQQKAGKPQRINPNCVGFLSKLYKVTTKYFEQLKNSCKVTRPSGIL